MQLSPFLHLGKMQYREAGHLAWYSWPLAEARKELSSSQPHALASKPFVYIEENTFFPFSPPMLLLDVEEVFTVVRRFYIKSFGIIWFLFLCLVDLFFGLNLSHTVSKASSVLVPGGQTDPPRRQSTSKAWWKKTQSQWGWSWCATNSPDGPEWFCAGRYYSIYLHSSTSWSMATSQHYNRKLTAFTEFNADLLTTWAKLKLHFSANKLVVFEFSFTFLFTASKNIIFCNSIQF